VKRFLLVLTVFLAGMTYLSADAVIKDFVGKVQVRFGDSTGWVPAEIGQNIPNDTVVSTGFNSKLILDLGNSTLEILPLTRMKLEEIKESQDTISTSLFLQGGKIKADVGKVEGKTNDFTVKSPVATASVRGTSFEFAGKTLKVSSGSVSFGPPPSEDASGPAPAPAIAVEQGGSSVMASADSKPVPPAAIAKAAATVVSSTKPQVIKAVVKETLSGTTAVKEAPASVGEILNTVTNVSKNANVSVTLEFPKNDPTPTPTPIRRITRMKKYLLILLFTISTGLFLVSQTKS
jgi:hypothetical protein